MQIIFLWSMLGADLLVWWHRVSFGSFAVCIKNERLFCETLRKTRLVS